MAVSFQTGGQSGSAPGTNTSVAVNVGSASDRALVVYVRDRDSNGIAAGSYAGVSLVNNGSYVYGLVAPASDSNTLSLTWNGYSMPSYAYASFNGVDQTTPFGTVVNNSGNAANVTTGSITCPTNGMVWASCMESKGVVSSTPTTQVGTYHISSSWYKYSSYDSTTKDFTWVTAGPGYNWFAVGIPINAVSGGGGFIATGRLPFTQAIQRVSNW